MIQSAIIRILPFVFVLVVLVVLCKRKNKEIQELCFTKPNSTKGYLLWTIGFLLFALLIELILYRCGLLEIDPWNHPLIPSIIRIFGAVVLAPITEEFVFRGLIINKLLKRNVNLHLTIFIQACFFVLVHNFTYENSLSAHIAIVQGFVDATLYGYARHYTKSIYTPITMHMSGNFIATLERFIC
ncbi:MAG: CPBP family intramembrane glutamic endopeptidase [Saprospiraceae bacterium]